MKILLISKYVSSSYFEKFEKLSKSKTVSPQQKFMGNIVNGFTANGYSLDLISIIPVSSKTHSKRKFKYFSEVIDKNTYHYPAFLNYIFLREKTQQNSTLKLLKKWCKKYPSEKKVVLLDGLLGHINKKITKFANKKGIKVISILTDSPYYASDTVVTRTIIKKNLYRIYNSMTEKSLELADAYVFLTEYMSSAFNKNGKPYRVIEGFCNSKQKRLTQAKEEGEFTIIYSGSIYKKYGVIELVKAVAQLGKPYYLIVYGNGEDVINVEDYERRYDNIKYGGYIPLSKADEVILDADLLINPRPVSGDYTKMSFPSKTIEYMASGVPTLTTKLEGIPKNYYPYLYFLESSESDAIMKKIDEISAQSKRELYSFGKKASNFIRLNTNEYIQVKKILDLIGEIINE